MTDLWFDREFGRLARRGAMLYLSRPDGVWAVLTVERTFPDDLTDESGELVATYGANAGGIGHLLLSDGVPLSASLTAWATAPTIPAAQLGEWVPTLVSIDGAAQSAHARDFDEQRVYATTCADGHLVILAPAAEPNPALSHQDGLDAPPRFVR